MLGWVLTGNSYVFRFFARLFIGIYVIVGGLIAFCWLLLAFGFWRLVAFGGFWRLLAFSGFWLLAAFGFWRLVAFGGLWWLWLFVALFSLGFFTVAQDMIAILFYCILVTTSTD